MQTKRFLVLLITAISLSAETKVFPTKGINYSDYKTFQIMAPRLFSKYKGVVDDDPTLGPVIRKAVNEHLTKKGMQEVTANPDVQVLVAGAERGSSMTQFFFSGYYFDQWWGYATPMYTVFNDFNREGVLAIGIVDPRTKKGIWVGFDTEGIGDPTKIDSAIQKAVSKLFKKYPPK